MFTIESTTHRVTTYVVNEAYKWLYNEIECNKYSSNKRRDGRALLLKIKTDKCVTEQTYKQFLAMLENRPFVYLTSQKNSSSKGASITTNHLLNYFVKFNNVILPLGFILDFFEDEYETEDERQALIDQYIQNERTVEFENQCRIKIGEQLEPLITFKEERPCIFETSPMFHVTNILRIALTAVLVVLFSMFMSETKMSTALMDFVLKAQFDAGKLLPESYGYISAFLFDTTLNAQNTYGEYFAAYAFHLIFNAGLLLVIICRVVSMLSYLITTAKIMICRSEVAQQEKNISYLEDIGIQDLTEYFKSIAPTLVRKKAFTPEMAENLPVAHKRYHSAISFNFENLDQTIESMYASKSVKKLALEYHDDDSLRLAKKQWRRGFVLVILLCMVVVLLNVSALFETLIPELSATVSNLMELLNL